MAWGVCPVAQGRLQGYTDSPKPSKADALRIQIQDAVRSEHPKPELALNPATQAGLGLRA